MYVQGSECDEAGNLRERPLNASGTIRAYRYTHDAWGRLVKIQKITNPGGSETVNDIEKFQYNGLSWRTVKQCDTTASPNGLDQMTVMIYSAGWQLLEERVDDGWTSGFTADKVYQTIYGLRYIDDVICRRLDHDADGNYTEGGTLTYYHLSDDQFSTVAVLDTNAALVERIDYDAYGQARHHFLGDIDGDGDQQTDDRTKISDLYGVAIGGSTYNVDCDIDRDNTIDSADHGLASSTYSAFAKGILSNVGNIYGFSNYVLNSEVNAGLVYTVRFRHYDTSLGRWLERDPLQYVDGMSMYGYCGGMPIGSMDRYGLSGWDDAGAAALGISLGAITTAWGLVLLPLAPPLVAIGVVAVGIYFLAHSLAEAISGDELDAWGYPTGRRLSSESRWFLAGSVFGGLLGMFGGAAKPAPIRSPISWKWIVDGLASGKLGKYAMDFAKGTWKFFAGSSEGGGCFVAGTLVLTAAGLLPIERVQAGEQVWSYDQAQYEWELETVNATTERWYEGDLVTLELKIGDGADEKITTTGNHPFWVSEGEKLADRPAVADLSPDEPRMTPTGRWTEARWLRLGDHFLTRKGKSATVVGLIIRMERAKVYNLQVNRLQLYAIGRAGVLVHNSGSPRGYKGVAPSGPRAPADIPINRPGTVGWIKGGRQGDDGNYYEQWWYYDEFGRLRFRVDQNPRRHGGYDIHQYTHPGDTNHMECPAIETLPPDVPSPPG